VNRVLVVARATAVELLRRRAVVVLLVAMPLAFYVARHDLTGQSIRFLSVGLAWAVSTLAAFAAIAGQAFDPRLRLAGYGTGDLLLGRLLGLLAVAVPLAAGYALVVGLDRDLDRGAGVLLALGLTVLIAVPFGLLIAAVVRRPLEAAMLLLVISGLQMILDPADPVTRVLPFWSVREVLTWTVDGTGDDFLRRGLVHAGATVAVLGGLTVALRTVALRRRSHLERVPVGGTGTPGRM
jgi:hypothetical protein